MSNNPKIKLRDAVLKDMKSLQCMNKATLEYFGKQDLELEFRESMHSLIVEQENGQLYGYANVTNFPNPSAIPRSCWLDYVRFYFGLPYITYGNTIFLTFMRLYDSSVDLVIKEIFTEVFLREPKIKYICSIAPPINCYYTDLFAKHGKRTYPLDGSKTSPSIFVFDKYNFVPRIQFRLAIIEDNDDLVELIDRRMKGFRKELGEFYIAEQVMRGDPQETIIVAEIMKQKAGMIWLNVKVNQKTLAEHFEIGVFNHFIKYQSDCPLDSLSVIDLYPKNSEGFFENLSGCYKRDSSPYSIKTMSLTNYYVNTSYTDLNSEDTARASQRSETDSIRYLFKSWQKISKHLKCPFAYINEIQSYVPTTDVPEAINVFAIQLFGIAEHVDPRRFYDLLAACFSAYPQKDYCIIALPSNEASSNSWRGPLLQYFSRVAPRAGCKVSDILFVAHRNSFVTDIEVNELTRADLDEVESIMYSPGFGEHQVYNIADIVQCMDDYMTNQWSPCDMLAFRFGSVLVGFAVLWQNTTMREYDKNFILRGDDFKQPEWKSGQLTYLMLHPAFLWEWRYIVREIFRMTGYTSMFYKLRDESHKSILNSILLNMFPLMPRGRLYQSYEGYEPYALYYINQKMCHMHRIQIEEKLVIVGFTTTCKGFLKELLYARAAEGIQFTNITVITSCTGQIEAEHDVRYTAIQKNMFYTSFDQFTENYLRRLEFRTWVKFLGGELKGIYSGEKKVMMKSGTMFHYDRLFLMTAPKFGTPKPFTVAPFNYFEINNRLDKITFYHKMELLAMKGTDLPIVIYGYYVMLHSCINAMIELGINASKIVLLIPPAITESFPDTFDEDFVESLILEEEEEKGVKIYQNVKFLNWTLYTPDDDSIESVQFETSSCGIINLKCLAFISFHAKEYSESFENALSSEVKFHNNRVVIDEKSKTNVPYVYGCGTMTVYEESLNIKQEKQQPKVNQREIGRRLALAYIQEILTGVQPKVTEGIFIKPKFRQYQLISDIVYGALRKPGVFLSRTYRRSSKYYGEEISTFSGSEYCRIILDENGFVAEITCTTKEFKTLEILYRIYGLHESYFKGLKEMHKEGKISNLLHFFHQNLYAAIFHDQFESVRLAIRKMNLDCLKEFLEDETTDNDKEEMLRILKKNNMERRMQKCLMQFVKQHHSLHEYYALDFEH